MSGQSVAPKQKPRHRPTKSGSFNPATTPGKRSDHHNHIQVQHQLPHSAIIPQAHQPSMPRSPASPPHTPRGNSKRRGRKNRPKDVDTSNVLIVDEQADSTGQDGGVRIPFAQPLDTPTRQAYAGPTFHSSPAPNELPVPKFFSKSVPSGLNEYLTEVPEDLGLTSESSSQSASPPSEGSPLDLLFRADRAERTGSKLAGPSSRATEFGSPKSRSTLNFTPVGSPTPMQSSSDFMFNLDNESDFSNLTNRSLSPLARLNTRPPRQTGSPFPNWKANNTKPNTPYQGYYGKPAQLNADEFSPFNQPPSVRYENSAPAAFDNRNQNAPNSSLDQSTADIRRMESDLRRILKLGPSVAAPQTVVS